MDTDITIFLIIAALTFFITYRKKKSQLGETWCGPVSATVTVKDKEFHCSHCGHNKFDKREGLLTTTWVTYFRFAFWNQSAHCFVCKNCGFIHWFLSPEVKAQINRDKD